MSDNDYKIAGNLTSDPELRFIPSGAAVTNFTVANTPRRFNKDTNQWEDAGETLFMRVNVWRALAENVAETLSKGDRVVVTGRLVQRSYETKEGEKRTVIELEADEVAVSLLRATARVTKAGSGTRGQAGGEAWGTPAPTAAAPAVADPWGSAGSSEPPF